MQLSKNTATISVCVGRINISPLPLLSTLKGVLENNKKFPSLTIEMERR
jgi:hypothetical protein